MRLDGTNSRSGGFGEEVNLLPLRRIEPRVYGEQLLTKSLQQLSYTGCNMEESCGLGWSVVSDTPNHLAGGPPIFHSTSYSQIWRIAANVIYDRRNWLVLCLGICVYSRLPFSLQCTVLSPISTNIIDVFRQMRAAEIVVIPSSTFDSPRAWQWSQTRDGGSLLHWYKK